MTDFKDRTVLKSNEMYVHNSTGGTIPAASFAILGAYTKASQYFAVTKPAADNEDPSTVVIIPEAIANGDTGIAIIDGLGVVLKTGGAVSAGNEVGADATAWTAILGLGFRVMYVDGNYLVVRKTCVGVNAGKWFKLSAVGSNPMTGKEQICSAGVFSDAPNVDTSSIYRYPQFTNQTSYQVNDYVYAVYVDDCWVSLYNTPIQVFECT